MSRRIRNKSKKNGKIIGCNFFTRPVFENEICQEFLKNINKETDNNCRTCKISF